MSAGFIGPVAEPAFSFSAEFSARVEERPPLVSGNLGTGAEMVGSTEAVLVDSVEGDGWDGVFGG
jgi:hypothetical protein